VELTKGDGRVLRHTEPETRSGAYERTVENVAAIDSFLHIICVSPVVGIAKKCSLLEAPFLLQHTLYIPTLCASSRYKEEHCSLVKVFCCAGLNTPLNVRH